MGGMLPSLADASAWACVVSAQHPATVASLPRMFSPLMASDFSAAFTTAREKQSRPFLCIPLHGPRPQESPTPLLAPQPLQARWSLFPPLAAATSPALSHSHQKTFLAVFISKRHLACLPGTWQLSPRPWQDCPGGWGALPMPVRPPSASASLTTSRGLQALLNRAPNNVSVTASSVQKQTPLPMPPGSPQTGD